jgi:glycosyltransferase involved in cell wall biosynthesis
LVLMRGQLEYLKKMGFRVAALCSPDGQVEGACGPKSIPILTIPMEREVSLLRDLVSLLQICRLLRRVRPTICNAGTPKAGLLVGVAGWLARVPCRIYTLRGLRLETATGLKRNVLSFTERITCASANRVICVSPSLRRRALELKLVRPEKALVLASGSSNGVDPSRFAPTAERLSHAAEIRQQHGIAPTLQVIGYVGRITRDKGISELLAAFRMLRERLHNVVLMLIGGYEPGDPVSPEIRAAIETSEDIVRLEFVPDTAPYYLVMDVLALPTHREGFPNAVLEAQAAGRPVVATDATGAIDSIVPNVTGLLVQVGDVRALADALTTLLSDQERAREMGSAGRERVCQQFRQEIVWKSLADLYCELLRERGLPIPAVFLSEAAPICSDTQ